MIMGRFDADFECAGRELDVEWLADADLVGRGNRPAIGAAADQCVTPAEGRQRARGVQGAYGTAETLVRGGETGPDRREQALSLPIEAGPLALDARLR